MQRDTQLKLLSIINQALQEEYERGRDEAREVERERAAKLVDRVFGNYPLLSKVGKQATKAGLLIKSVKA